MIIQCPQCHTRYNLPDSSIGDRPRKLRCAKCRNVFAISRRTSDPPEGYVEYTGAQHLPPEFAFLGQPPQAPDQERSDAPGDGAPQPSADTPQAATPQAAPDTVDRGGAVPGDTPVAAPVPPPTPAGPSGRVYHSLPAEAMFGGSSVWEVEAPMELGSYSMPADPAVTQRHQLWGKVAFLFVVFIAAFLVFVSWRNGWSLSFQELPEQVRFALSSAPTEHIPEAAENLSATPLQRRLIQGADGTYLVVSGEVINDNPTKRTHILVRGRLVSASGDIAAQVVVPCGRIPDDEEVSAASRADVPRLYAVGAQPYNCTLSAQESTAFSLVFTDLPDDYDATYEVQTKVVDAALE